MPKLILIIEDNKTIAMYEKETLNSLGYDVVIAYDMESAEDLIKFHKKDIMLSIVDINLPDTQDEVLNYLLKKNIPSIAMTGSFHQKLRDKVVDKNIIDYIVLEDDQQLELLKSTVNRIMNNKHRKILIVDDSKSSRFALNSLLKFQNFTILEANNAKNALAILKNNTDVSIALIDYEMPGMNGADLTRVIRQNYSRMELSILAISIHTTPIVTIEFLKAGANDFITKPYIKEEVLARIGVNIDIMDQHQLLLKEVKQRQIVEDELRESQKAANNANRAKSNFLANMSHEVRTPMNAIIGFVDILCKNEMSTEKLSQLNIIRESSESLMNVINDILDFSKIESGKLSIESTLFKSKEPFELTVKLFFTKAKEKNISILLNIDKNLPEEAYGDVTRIKQIFANLLSNAIKFSKANSNIEIDVSYMKESSSLYCSVKDYGTGIAADNLDKIFNVFEQEDNSITRKFGGSGLGLSISKSLTNLMNGDIKVESELNVGSKFYFHVAVFKDIEKHIELNHINKEIKTKSENVPISANVLVVEDNKSNQLLMEILLKELGIEVTLVNDGLEAIEYFDKYNYDLILMDENMPNMNGMKATSKIRKMTHKKQVPIISVTANALKGDKERLLASGMDDYLSKPIDQKKLELLLRKYL